MARRVTTLVAVMVAVAVLAFGIPTAFTVHDTQRHALELELIEEAFVAAATLAPDEAATVANVAPVPSDEAHRIALYAIDGRKLDGVGPAQADEVVRRAATGDVAHATAAGEDVAAVLVPRNGGEQLVLRVAEDSDEVTTNLQRRLFGLGLVALVVLVVAMLLGWLLAVRLTRPVRALRTVAAELGEGRAEPGMSAPSGIAELDDLSATLVASARRVSEAMARERQFSSHVAHQLRTPITAARVAVEAELADPRPVPALALHEVLGAIERLESTTAQLLSLSRGLELERELTDAGARAGSAGVRWADAFAAAGRELAVEAEPVLTPVLPAAIDQVLDVLLDNALRHGRGRCTVRAESFAGIGAVTVADEGETVADAFEVRSTGGHGIGLKFARTLAEAERGALDLVSSRPAVFRLFVPPAGRSDS